MYKLTHESLNHFAFLLIVTVIMVFSYYLLSWNISSPRHSWISRDSSSRANFQLRVYKLRRTLLEHLSTVPTNLQIPGNISEIPGDFPEIFSEIMSEIISVKSLGISEHLEICKNGREILQKCPSKFINTKLKVGTARGSLEIQECVSERRYFRSGDIS